MDELGFTVWFTGLSGSGKSTLAALLCDKLTARGKSCELLDSGRLRQALNRSLGFSREEIEANIRRIGYECKLLNRNGIVTLVAAVSPYKSQRDHVRGEIGRFVEVFCRCPVEVLAARDTSGLIERARKGEIAHVAGVNAPYEEPDRAEVILDTDRISPDEGVGRIIEKLGSLAYLPEHHTAEYTADEEAMIKQRLSDLGYI